MFFQGTPVFFFHYARPPKANIHTFENMLFSSNKFSVQLMENKCLIFNPFIPSGLFHINSLDKFISYKGVAG